MSEKLFRLFWNESQNVLLLRRKVQPLLKQFKPMRECDAQLSQLLAEREQLHGLLRERDAPAEVQREAEAELDAWQDKIVAQCDALERLALYECNDELSLGNVPAYVDVQAGAGGDDSNDWATMLRDMYVKWAGRGAQVLDESAKGCTLRIDVPWAAARLQYESGVHRLVRKSPFSKDGARHTSFASVHVYARSADSSGGGEAALRKADVRVDRFRASGAGGQHVNSTDSAVRVTHVPSGIVAQSQTERSQHRNLALAMGVLEARIADAKRQQELAQRLASRAALGSMAFGSESVVRSVTLDPSERVKCARSSHSSSNAQTLLSGKALEFWLRAAARKMVLDI